MITKNAAATLSNFCKWQHDVNVADDSDPRHHDTAVLLTRYVFALYIVLLAYNAL